MVTVRSCPSQHPSVHQWAETPLGLKNKQESPGVHSCGAQELCRSHTRRAPAIYSHMRRDVGKSFPRGAPRDQAADLSHRRGWQRVCLTWWWLPGRAVRMGWVSPGTPPGNGQAGPLEDSPCPKEGSQIGDTLGLLEATVPCTAVR